MNALARVTLIGTLAALGGAAQADDDPAEPAWLRILTPGFTARIEIVAADGGLLAAGETGLLAGPLELPPGAHDVCLVAPLRGRLCRTLQLRAGQTVEWVAWPGELRCAGEDVDAVPCVAAGRVALPARAVRARIVVAGAPGGAVRVPDDGTVDVPPFRDVWVEMLDADGRICVCHVGERASAEPYRCAWSCAGETAD